MMAAHPQCLTSAMATLIHPTAFARKFSGKCAHRIIKGGVGHNLPQEAPQAFAEVVVEVGGY